MTKKEYGLQRMSQLDQRDFLKEIEEHEKQNQVSGGWGWKDLSKSLGNKGYVCTLTKECQKLCR
ncbi:Lantibiotic lichenicidin VK21 A1 precursor [Listeria grayi]|uniref:Plantaricin C family lantibiotic n=1 Tax=Listeria grayi FSL F6-1183 TaxID=1265827 RepID=A0A829RB04_LISGR|nr:plantaricin C family lantibiotic [Listeria grayi]EUJ30427.1 hypothetical protein LMUR_01065 [Listeria grayi FSL F6-1183]VEI31237.1 Lantibiotic lichenicidin VK21 A1 precursor [Listeria grayi]